MNDRSDEHPHSRKNKDIERTGDKGVKSDRKPTDQPEESVQPDPRLREYITRRKKAEKADAES